MKFCLLNDQYLFLFLSVYVREKKQDLDFADQCFAQTLSLFHFLLERERKKIIFRVLLACINMQVKIFIFLLNLNLLPLAWFEVVCYMARLRSCLPG